MKRKKMLIAIAAVALGIAGAVSSAQAGNDREERGGFRIGPFGQRMGGPLARGAFAFAPRHFRVHRRYYRYYY